VRTVRGSDHPCSCRVIARIHAAGLAEGNHAAAESRSGKPGPVDSLQSDQPVYQIVQYWSGHLEVVGEAAVALDEQRTGTGQVAGGQGGDHGVDAGALGDDVARSAAEQRIAKADDGPS